MKEQLKQLIKELEQRSQDFAELYIYDSNKFWKGKADEAELIAEKLRQITTEWEEAPYAKHGDDGDLLPG